MNMSYGALTSRWRKSSYSGDTGGQCVEVAALSEQIGVRDSKYPDVAHLAFTPSVFRAFTEQLRAER